MPMDKAMPKKFKEYMDTERAVAKNSKVTGKARTMDLVEKRKAMPKRKKQVASIPKPVGPIGL
jgi:hypothetical protein